MKQILKPNRTSNSTDIEHFKLTFSTNNWRFEDELIMTHFLTHFLILLKACYMYFYRTLFFIKSALILKCASKVQDMPMCISLPFGCCNNRSCYILVQSNFPTRTLPKRPERLRLTLGGTTSYTSSNKELIQQSSYP